MVLSEMDMENEQCYKTKRGCQPISYRTNDS